MRLAQKNSPAFDSGFLAAKVIVLIALFFLVVLFGWLALVTENPLSRIGDLIWAAAGIWLARFIWLYDKIAIRSYTSQNPVVYTDEVAHRYDSQIELQKSYKYFALLCLLGLAMSNAHSWMDRARSGRLNWIDFILVGLQVLLFGGGALVNGVVAPRLLEKDRKTLVAATAKSEPRQNCEPPAGATPPECG
jgi:hypothetical protein